MDHLIGQRFSLISKSEIRYVGTLHEINPEQSTISLEDVFSFGTEDRMPDNFIPPSQQKFDYIVFRGSDVKDIKIAEEQKENQQPSPPPVPNDPAILTCAECAKPCGYFRCLPSDCTFQRLFRSSYDETQLTQCRQNASRPAPPPDPRGQSPFPPPGYPPQPHFGQFPPPPNQFGRGFGPPGGFGGPGPQFYPPPPPGYYGGPPPGPFGPGPGPFPQSTQPIGLPGQRGPNPPLQPPVLSEQTSELPDNKAPTTKQTPEPTESTQKPSTTTTAEVIAKAEPTQSKANKVVPAVPFTVNQKSFVPPGVGNGLATATNGDKSSSQAKAPQASMEDASRQAKAAVAEAMARLNPNAAQSRSIPSAEAIDALSRKVGEMSTGAPPSRGRGGNRGGRAIRGTSSGQRKIEIPQSDYDFASANAKFNKDDLIKEAIATGSPVGETQDVANDVEEPVGERKDSATSAAPAYNKSTSFFDNISSEAREREETGDVRAQARALRGQEFKKNMETFGQGNVDGGYRGGYRGRGRGRGFGRGYNRGYSRGRGRGASETAAPAN